MSKIIVPQEQQDQIIKLYVDNQYGLEKIRKTLNLPFGSHVIKRVLKENNIHIRNFQESSRIKRPIIEVPQELQNEIINLYNQGYGLSNIVETLHLTFSFDKVRSILEDNNVHIRNIKEAAQVKIMPDLRKYPINDDYILESHNGAWLLGFVAADGYLPITKGAKNKIVIALQRQDEEILHMIAKEINFEGPICQYEQILNNKIYSESSLSFTSKIMRQKFEEYGIVNNKTFKFNHIPDLPKEFKIDFIRGFFDGDGSISLSKEKETGREKVTSSFTSASKQLLQEISDFLHEEYNFGERTIYTTQRTHEIYNICYFQKDTLKLGKIFYDNDYISLPRKKKKYFEILNKKTSPTSLDIPKG